MKFQLWSEGFAATGESATASYEGEFEGETFMDAYLALVKARYGDKPPSYVRLNEPVIWGCRVYDNEADARKGFG
jgi:hypothetical protein